jgi:hypothetical protein
LAARAAAARLRRCSGISVNAASGDGNVGSVVGGL